MNFTIFPKWLAFVLLALSAAPLTAQTHLAVPAGAPVYFMLEQAELRGLCAPLPETRPFTRRFVVETIDAILSSDKPLSQAEQAVFEAERVKYAPNANTGLDLKRGVFRLVSPDAEQAFPLEAGLSYELAASGAYYFSGGAAEGGFDTWLSAHASGDLGKSLSYTFPIGVGLVYAPRAAQSPYVIDVAYPANTEKLYAAAPAAYFPFSYHSPWDGWLFPLSDLSASGQTGWPQKLALGFTLKPEFAGSFLNDALFFRLGRLERDWGGVVAGSSLALNQFAQPFFGAEVSITPLRWFRFSGLTGILEYENTQGIQTSSQTFQSAFSMTLFEVNYLNYVHIDAGSSVIWPKRFEMAYLFPLMDKLLYQNNIGDFDNLAIFGSLKLQKPGLGFVWFSLFLDEANPQANFFSLDREMYAFQGGLRVHIPGLPFAALSLSYTKVEPYCYTHPPLDNTPWYKGIAVEERYLNHGANLGYYLPPNADEIKLRFEAAPLPGGRFFAQFQLIRHGADHGESAVDGSSYYSNLATAGRSENPALRKFFLHDGAYQWFYILKAGGSYRLRNYPVEFLAEAGGLFSYYTDIEAGRSNSGSSYPFTPVDTAEYPRNTGIILSLGVKVFP